MFMGFSSLRKGQEAVTVVWTNRGMDLSTSPQDWELGVSYEGHILQSSDCSRRFPVSCVQGQETTTTLPPLWSCVLNKKSWKSDEAIFCDESKSSAICFFHEDYTFT